MEGAGILKAGRGGEVSMSSESNLGQRFPSTIFEKYIKCEQDRPKPATKPATPSVLGMPQLSSPFLPSCSITSSPSACKHGHVSPMLKIHEIPCQPVSVPAPFSWMVKPGSSSAVPGSPPLLPPSAPSLRFLPAARHPTWRSQRAYVPQGLILWQSQAH